MKRTLMTLALVAAAGTAGAQTVTTPPVSGATIMTPSVGSGSVTAPSVTAPNTANVPAPNAAGSAGARARIEADGYKDVQGLNRNPDGSWRGQALRGNARVGVGVDARGNVSSQ